MSSTDRIVALLRESDLTPTELAQSVGISRATVYRLLKGERDPRQSELDRIARALGVNTTDLTGLGPDVSRETVTAPRDRRARDEADLPEGRGTAQA